MLAACPLKATTGSRSFKVGDKAGPFKTGKLAACPPKDEAGRRSFKVGVLAADAIGNEFGKSELLGGRSINLTRGKIQVCWRQLRLSRATSRCARDYLFDQAFLRSTIKAALEPSCFLHSGRLICPNKKILRWVL